MAFLSRRRRGAEGGGGGRLSPDFLIPKNGRYDDNYWTLTDQHSSVLLKKSYNSTNDNEELADVPNVPPPGVLPAGLLRSAGGRRHGLQVHW